jgi:glycosyltransferase involved in cell wall biosynthesis
MPPIKLLLITNRYPAHKDDSASPFVADFVAGLNRNGIKPTILTPFYHADRYEDDSSIVRFKWGESERTIGSLPLLKPSSWFKIVSYVRRGYAEAERLHRAYNFDFCLALWAAPSGLFAHKLNRKFGLPYAVWCLGSDIHTYTKIPIVGNMILETLNASDRVFSDGYDLGQMAEKLSGCTYHFLPSFRRIDYSPPTDRKRDQLLICPGRIEKSKGVFDLLEAFQSIANRHSSWSLYYVGEGRARDKLQKRISAYGLSSQVKSFGFMRSEEMFGLMGRAAGIIIPTHRDSLPLTFGEAMQLKRPVIVTDVGDLRHFTEKYHVGMVVPPASPSLLAQALTRFITEEKNYENGFDECVDELNIDRATDCFSKWLKNHLGQTEPVEEIVQC